MKSAPATSVCPGCGLVLPVWEGPTHPYTASSPACWALYGEVLAREYSDPAYSGVHQITVDAYAVQHPRAPERRAIQSVAVHLITLCLVLEDGIDPLAGPRLHKQLVSKEPFEWLEPPKPNGTITVADVLRTESLAEHKRMAYAWAQNVWAAWAPHHAIVRAWIEQRLR